MFSLQPSSVSKSKEVATGFLTTTDSLVSNKEMLFLTMELLMNQELYIYVLPMVVIAMIMRLRITSLQEMNLEVSMLLLINVIKNQLKDYSETMLLIQSKV